VVARQQVGHPVDRANILRRARDESMLLNGKPLTDGWYTRFMNRHHQLTNRMAQSFSKVRNSVDEEQVHVLFNTLTRTIHEHEMDASSVFNVDETAFQSRKKSRSSRRAGRTGAERVAAVGRLARVMSQTLAVELHKPERTCSGCTRPPQRRLSQK